MNQEEPTKIMRCNTQILEATPYLSLKGNITLSHLCFIDQANNKINIKYQSLNKNKKFLQG